MEEFISFRIVDAIAICLLDGVDLFLVNSSVG